MNCKQRVFGAVFLFVALYGFLASGSRPERWMRYCTLEEAGWSGEKLFDVCNKTNGASGPTRSGNRF